MTEKQTTSHPVSQTSTLLLVDDVPTNLKVLFSYLKDLGFKVRIARDGEDALAQVALAKPDLILLDVMMPKMDGFEACRRLKSHTETCDIPVIFMTALTDTLDKVKGFEIGAVDYITKPIQQDEVLARINAHLTIRNLQKTLQQKNIELQQQNQELEAFAHTVAHDLKNPLNAVINYTDSLQEDLATTLDAENLETLKHVKTAAWKMVSIIDALLLLANSRREDIKMHKIDMQEVISQVQQRLSPFIAELQATVILPTSWPDALGFAPWIEEVWTNYMSNSLKYGGRPPQLVLGATIDDSTGQMRFWVHDNGEGLTREEQQRLFVPFTRIGQVRVEGHGLGLSIVQRIVERCGGQVGVESEKGQGSTFYFTLPVETPL
ncbi:MAG: hybrid sensor histidine kinase/response regulator [Beggiatoa sp. IS2]|nr:MAG: hybrid sensor histidine kinase/response regulator [Beggiatoa sp. IS2]